MLFKISRIVITLFFLGSTYVNAEVVNQVVIKGNKRVSEDKSLWRNKNKQRLF